MKNLEMCALNQNMHEAPYAESQRQKELKSFERITWQLFLSFMKTIRNYQVIKDTVNKYSDSAESAALFLLEPLENDQLSTENKSILLSTLYKKSEKLKTIVQQPSSQEPFDRVGFEIVERIYAAVSSFYVIFESIDKYKKIPSSVDQQNLNDNLAKWKTYLFSIKLIP